MKTYTDIEVRDFKVKLALGGVGKKIPFVMVGVDGNAFVLLGQFRKLAEKEGWTTDDIEFVMWYATLDDYDHLLRVLTEHSSDPMGYNSDKIKYIDGKAYKLIE